MCPAERIEHDARVRSSPPPRYVNEAALMIRA